MFAALSKAAIASASFITGALVALVVSFFVLQHRHGTDDAGTSIIFPDKIYADSGANASFVSIEGRWTGVGVAYKNNATQISCYKLQNECLSYSIEQIGPNQIGDLDPPLSMPIKKWDADVITASDEGLDVGVFCARSTLNIDRRNGSAELVTEPINQATLNCAKADNRTYKWFLDDSIFWNSVRQK
jgi:hypothetical protein